MAKFRLFYVPTAYIKTLSELGTCAQDELHVRGIAAVKQLADLSALYLFEKLDKAKEYVAETKLTYLHQGNKVEEQRGIVELLVNVAVTTSQQYILTTAENTEQVRDFQGHARNTHKAKKGDSKSYSVLRQTENDPAAYVVRRVWLKDSSPIELPASAPKTYKKFFDNRQLPQYKAAGLFTDYYNPRNFSFHWGRHYQAEAKIIESLLLSCTKLSEAYESLLLARRIILKDNPTINPEGSFMRRIDYALGELTRAIDTKAEANSCDKRLSDVSRLSMLKAN